MMTIQKMKIIPVQEISFPPPPHCGFYHLIACIRSAVGNCCILSRFFSFLLASNKFSLYDETFIKKADFATGSSLKKFKNTHIPYIQLLCARKPIHGRSRGPELLYRSGYVWKP
jgi:hypothetical protein